MSNGETPRHVLEKTATYYRVSLHELKGKSRRAEIVFPRQVVMYFLRKELHLQLEAIGSFLGGRDHTTIMHGIEKIETLLATHDTKTGQETKEVRALFREP